MKREAKEMKPDIGFWLTLDTLEFPSCTMFGGYLHTRFYF